MIHDDMFEDIVGSIQEGDKYGVLLFKAGGFLARKDYTDWLSTLLAQVLQTQLVYETQLIRLQQENQVLREQMDDLTKQAEETQSRTQATTQAFIEASTKPTVAELAAAAAKAKSTSKPTEGK